MSLGFPRSIPFAFLFVLLALAFVCIPDDGRAQPVPVTNIENAAGDSVLTVFEDGGVAAFGEADTGVIPAEGAGSRMMWYPAKAAFRAGVIYDGYEDWDDANIGRRSAAFGVNTEASGSTSFATGFGSRASGAESTAMGNGAVATGSASAALGRGNATGTESTAMGDANASGEQSTAMGLDTEASGDQSTAMGRETEASGPVATAMGEGTIADAPNSLSIGNYNDANTGCCTTSFVVGNGSPDNRSDALVLSGFGDLTINGTLTENSDRRLKTQIQPLGAGVLALLGEIEPVRFQFKDEHTHPSGTQLGLIAQEVQAQFPELVSEGTSGYLSVSYSKFTAVLLKGLQEQQAEIDRMEAKVNRMDQLEARLAKLEQQDTSRLAALGGPWSAAALLALGLLGLGLFVQRQQRA